MSSQTAATVTVSALANATSKVITGLERSTAYNVTVTPQNQYGNGTAAGPLAQTTWGPPAAPVVTVTPGDTVLDATWSAPATNGSAITGYTVRVTPQNSQPSWDVTLGASGTWPAAVSGYGAISPGGAGATWKGFHRGTALGLDLRRRAAGS